MYLDINISSRERYKSYTIEFEDLHGRYIEHLSRIMSYIFRDYKIKINIGIDEISLLVDVDGVTDDATEIVLYLKSISYRITEMSLDDTESIWYVLYNYLSHLGHTDMSTDIEFNQWDYYYKSILRSNHSIQVKDETMMRHMELISGRSTYNTWWFHEFRNHISLKLLPS